MKKVKKFFKKYWPQSTLFLAGSSLLIFAPAESYYNIGGGVGIVGAVAWYMFSYFKGAKK